MRRATGTSTVAVLSDCCCPAVTAALPCPASAGAWGGAAYRRLLQGLPTLDGDLTSSEAAEIQAAAEAAGGDAGQYTDWVTACEAGRRRCANLRLASWGYQCETLDHSACCLQPNGRFCVPVALFANETTPETWVGRDNTTAPVDSPSPSPKPEGDETADGEDGSQKDGSADTQENAEPEQQDEDSERDESSQAEDTPARKDRKAERGSDKKGEDKGSRGGKWRSATATFFNSYPACCTSDSADQTECDDYNGCQVQEHGLGCGWPPGRLATWPPGADLHHRLPEPVLQWAGMFAGASGKKSKGWVSDHDIVAVFEAGNNKVGG